MQIPCVFLEVPAPGCTFVHQIGNRLLPIFSLCNQTEVLAVSESEEMWIFLNAGRLLCVNVASSGSDRPLSLVIFSMVNPKHIH